MNHSVVMLNFNAEIEVLLYNLFQISCLCMKNVRLLKSVECRKNDLLWNPSSASI